MDLVLQPAHGVGLGKYTFILFLKISKSFSSKDWYNAQAYFHGIILKEIYQVFEYFKILFNVILLYIIGGGESQYALILFYILNTAEILQIFLKLLQSKHYKKDFNDSFFKKVVTLTKIPGIKIF